MITAEVKHELDQFDKSMGQYVALSRRMPAEVVAQKGAQILMGNKSPRFPGLFDALRDLSPAEGSITTEQLAQLRNRRSGDGPHIKVRRRARMRAQQLLMGRPSGLFSLMTRGSGRVDVRQVRFRKRGDRRITNRSNKGGVIRISRRQDALGGERLLNKISLGVALELSIREQGRGYTAISFLPKSYRKLMGKLRAGIRRDKAARAQHKKDMNKALTEGLGNHRGLHVMRNATGQALGRLVFLTDQKGAAMRITGFTPPQKRSEAHSRVADVLHYVNADMGVYISRKLERNRATVGRFGKN